MDCLLIKITSTPIKSIDNRLNSVEERAVIQALNSVGAGKIYLMPEPVAAAIGAKLPIDKSGGNMIVNLGGGTAEIAVLSLNGIVGYDSHRLAGDALNDAIIDYLKKNHNLLIGELTAEKIKIEIGTAMSLKRSEKMDVSGKDLKTGQPRTVEITSNELIEPIRSVLNDIIVAIKRVISRTPPELMSDLIERGVAMSGGTSMLRGIDEYFSKTIGVSFYVVEDPITCVVRGLNTALGNIEGYRRSLR